MKAAASSAAQQQLKAESPGLAFQRCGGGAKQFKVSHVQFLGKLENITETGLGIIRDVS